MLHLFDTTDKDIGEQKLYDEIQMLIACKKQKALFK